MESVARDYRVSNAMFVTRAIDFYLAEKFGREGTAGKVLP
jgi:hypothetical protein